MSLVAALGGKGKRFYEIINQPEADNRNAEEIIADIITNAGLKEVSTNECIGVDGDIGA